jgi:hypothetical protein
VTATFASASSNTSILVVEYTGLGAYDQEGANNGTAATSGSVAAAGDTSSADEVAVVGFATGAASGSWTATAPYTARTDDAVILAHLLDNTLSSRLPRPGGR